MKLLQKFLSEFLFLLYPNNLKIPNFFKVFFGKNRDGECKLYQVVQRHSPSEFLQKRRRKSSVSSGCLGIISFLLFACSQPDTQNAVFEEKFGPSYEKVKAERTPAKGSDSKIVVLQAPTAEDLRNMSNEDNQNGFTYVDVNKFGERIPQAALPNGESYEQARVQNPSNALPPDLFEIGYNTELYPAFRKTGAEFDNISVPSTDVYGVKTEMSEKPYLLAGNDSLQKNINQTNAEQTADDIEISEILIKEQKQLKRKQKMQEIFGTDSLEMEVIEPDEESFAKRKMVKVKGSKNAVKEPTAQKKPEEAKQGTVMEAIKKIFKK